MHTHLTCSEDYCNELQHIVYVAFSHINCIPNIVRTNYMRSCSNYVLAYDKTCCYRQLCVYKRSVLVPCIMKHEANSFKLCVCYSIVLCSLHFWQEYQGTEFNHVCRICSKHELQIGFPMCVLTDGQGYIGLFRVWLTFCMQVSKKVKGHEMG